jgi:hypothetical protein
VLIPGAVVGALVLLSVVGAVAGDPDDSSSPSFPTFRGIEATTARPGAPTTAPRSATTQRVGATTRPRSTTTTRAPVDEIGTPSGGVGAVLELDGGARLRLLSVTPGADPLDDLIPPAAGTSWTRLDVELCAGSAAIDADPYAFSAALADGTSAYPEFARFEFASIGLAPGACTRGLVEIGVPDGGALATVDYLDYRTGAQAHWDLAAPSVAVVGPLTAAVPVAQHLVGAVAAGPDGSTATLRGVEPGATPINRFLGPRPGHSFSRLDVEMCAGSDDVDVGPFVWLGRQDDGFTANAAVAVHGLEHATVPAGTCVEGTVDIEVADGHRLTEVVWVGLALDEQARWSVA